mmetsp:Transcript_7388/g.16199  ORF Transcript_7388/g.16199 Transcript_7388/m.16199 type:complete len:276 (-) Transcript_7388:2602-3429(-)
MPEISTVVKGVLPIIWLGSKPDMSIVSFGPGMRARSGVDAGGHAGPCCIIDIGMNSGASTPVRCCNKLSVESPVVMSGVASASHPSCGTISGPLSWKSTLNFADSRSGGGLEVEGFSAAGAASFCSASDSALARGFSGSFVGFATVALDFAAAASAGVGASDASVLGASSFFPGGAPHAQDFLAGAEPSVGGFKSGSGCACGGLFSEAAATLDCGAGCCGLAAGVEACDAVAAGFGAGASFLRRRLSFLTTTCMSASSDCCKCCSATSSACVLQQ